MKNTQCFWSIAREKIEPKMTYSENLVGQSIKSRPSRTGLLRNFSVMNAEHNQEPRVINVDKNAAYPPAIDKLKAEGTLTKTTELRPVKYLNNIVEQDHRAIKRLVKPRARQFVIDNSRITIQLRARPQRALKTTYILDYIRVMNPL